MRRSAEVTAHVFFWIVFTLFVFMLSKIYLQAKPDAEFSRHLYYVVFQELVMGLILFYTTYLGIAMTRGRNRRKLVLAAILFVMLLFFAYPATRFGIWQVMSSLIPHILVIFLAVVFRRFSDSVKLEKEKQLLLLQNTQSELALLKLQVSPHFLFNTLNNIDYLISHDTVKASNSISKLGEILRYMLYDAKIEKIPLSAELRHIEDYIGLIRLRAFDPDYLKYRVTGQPGYLQIAPMLFLPLIENAYKHAAAKEGENVILIDIAIDGRSLRFVIDNEYDPLRRSGDPFPGGIGLNIVRRRLDLMYHGSHNFNVYRENNRYRIDVELKLDEY